MKKSKVKLLIITLIIILIAGGAFIVYYTYFHKKDGQHELSKPEKKDIWTCTMHPQVKSDRPGVCPICEMELIKMSDDESAMDEKLKNQIKLTDNKIVLANVSTVRIQKAELKNRISAYSYLDFADQNRKVISAKFNGRIEKLLVAQTGDFINAGQPLFEVFSPDLVQAQNDFLLALNSGSGMNTTLNSAIKKLKLFGFTEAQIKELEQAKEAQLTIKYHSPISGIVIEKKVQEGMYFNEGTTLYDVADLSMLWNIAEINQQDLNTISLGSQVKLTIQSYPGEIFTGKVTYIYPVLNAQTRTIKIRCEFSNFNGKLKPQMFGETVFERSFGTGLVVPADAILFTGKKNIVWLKTGDGIFEPREVKIGMKINAQYQLLSGIDENDEIAVTGGYLIDSESQLKTGMPTEAGLNAKVESQPNPPNPKPNTLNPLPEKNKSSQSSLGETSNKQNQSGTPEGSIVRKGVVDLERIDKNKDGKVFQDPMDWNVISDKPGKCPLCEMKLKEVTLEVAKQNLKKHGFSIK
ncbi:MAG: HlyD protein [Ignavibacteria bacterium]|nr:HlyD protein [Ignavibacteria bacterium]